jgi:hypothetical protein
MIANSKVQRGYYRCIVKQLLEDVPTPLTLTFSDFGDESSFVERLRVLWKEDDNCYDPLRSMEFEKIAMSNDDFSSPRTAARLGAGNSNAAGGQGNGGGSFFKRMTGSVLGIIESTAEKVIEKKTKEVLGDDEEEKDKKPPQR